MSDTENIQAWLGTLDLDQKEDLLRHLMDIGILCLDHLRDFDIEKDIEELPLKKMEKRRFKRAWRALAQEKSWVAGSCGPLPLLADGVKLKTPVEHSPEFLKKRKARYMQTYRAKLRQDPERRCVLDRIRENDKKRYRRKQGRQDPDIPAEIIPAGHPDLNTVNHGSVLDLSVPDKQGTSGQVNREERQETVSMDVLDDIWSVVTDNPDGAMSIVDVNKVVDGGITMGPNTAHVDASSAHTDAGVSHEVAGSVDVEVVFRDDQQSQDSVIQQQALEFRHSPLPIEESLFGEFSLTSEEDVNEENIKSLWTIAIKKWTTDVAFLVTGELILCTQGGVILFSDGGTPLKSPFDTSVGNPRHVSVNKLTGALAFAGNDTDVIYVVQKQGITWTQTAIRVSGGYPELVSWTSPTTLVTIVKIGTRQRHQFRLYDTGGKCLWKHASNVNNDIKYMSMIVDLPNIFIHDKYGEYITEVYHVDSSSCFTKRYFPKDKHARKIKDIIGMIKDSHGRIILFDKIDSKILSITLWQNDGSYVCSVIDKLNVPDFLCHDNFGLSLKADKLLAVSMYEHLLVFDISDKLSQ